MIDLGKKENITGIRILESTQKVSIDMSVDGKEWEGIDTIDVKNKEISLTTFIAGAHVLGRQVRYIRLQALKALPILKVEIYAK